MRIAFIGLRAIGCCSGGVETHVGELATRMAALGHEVTVFNVAGNKYRLLAAIHYNRQKLFVLAILTHAEYSRGGWKEQL